MNLVEMKSPKDVTIDGVTVSFVTQDKNLLEVCLSAGGKRYIVKRQDTYSNNIKMFRADEYTVEKKHVLEGEVLGIKVSERFDSVYDAERRKSVLEAKTDAVLTITERDVKLNDAGELAPELADSDVPF